MRQTSLIVLSALLVAPLFGGCMSQQERAEIQAYGPNNSMRPERRAQLPPNAKGDEEMVWSQNQAPDLFRSGVTYRAYYHPRITPSIPDWHVLSAKGKVIETAEGVRAQLVPINSAKRARAYRSLLAALTMDPAGDSAWTAMKHSRRLQFTADRDEGYGQFYASTEAQRWGIGHEPAGEVLADRIVITQPAYCTTGNIYHWQNQRIDLVRETITRDGRYTRDVVRTLEDATGAEKFKPMPLL